MIANYSNRSYSKQKARTLVQPLQLGDRVRMIRTATGLVKGSYATKEGATNEERTQPAASISTDKARHCTLQLDSTE